MTGDDVNRTRDAMRTHAERYADLGLGPEARDLAGLPDFPPAPSSLPLILDTDIGGDPDDAFALVVAAQLPELTLVVTSDEYAGRRARLARHLLDLLGRADVPVVAGRDLGNTRYWAADGLVPDDASDQSTDVGAAVDDVLARQQGPVRWLGIGAWSNLADLLTDQPDLAQRLTVTLMGGGLNYRHPDRAEHNIRLDVDAARTVLSRATRPWIVPSDVTFHPDNEVTTASPEYGVLAQTDAPAWAMLLRTYVDQWFARFHAGTMQHDAMALALAMGLPFLDATLTGVDLDPIGRMITGAKQVFLTRSVDYQAFRRWLRDRLQNAADTYVVSHSSTN